MKAIHLYIVLLVLLVYTNKSKAEILDSTSIKYRYKIGIDILKPWGYILRSSDSIARKSYRIKFELLSSFQITKKFSANLDLGYGKGVEYAYNGAQRYESRGVYFKPGFDYNILSEEDINTSNVAFLFGYRLGLSFFHEKNQFLFRSNFWNSENLEEANWQSFTYWHEVITSVRFILLRIEKQAFSLGITPRLRIKPQKTEHTRLFIPGYGENDPFNIAMNLDFAFEF